MQLPMLDDEHAPSYTVGQVAAMLGVQQAFLRRIDDQQVVTPQRSPGSQPASAGIAVTTSAACSRW